jgi:hypothetical protein
MPAIDSFLGTWFPRVLSVLRVIVGLHGTIGTSLEQTVVPQFELPGRSRIDRTGLYSTG